MANLGIRLKLDRVQLDQIRAIEPGSTIYQAHVRAAEALVAEAKKEAPVRTGRLRDAIDYEIRGFGRGLSATVGIVGDQPGGPQEYAAWVMDGTNGPIEPQKGPLLVIRDGRGPVYHRRVSGQASNPFLLRALRAMQASDWQGG